MTVSKAILPLSVVFCFARCVLRTVGEVELAAE